MIEVGEVGLKEEQSEGDCGLEACFEVIRARDVAAPEEEEVSGGEGSINDVGVCGVVEGEGEVTEVGSGPRGDGVIWDGEGDWRRCDWREVVKGSTLEGGVGLEGGPGEGEGGGEAKAGEVGTCRKLLRVRRKKAGR